MSLSSRFKEWHISALCLISCIAITSISCSRKDGTQAATAGVSSESAPQGENTQTVSSQIEIERLRAENNRLKADLERRLMSRDILQASESQTINSGLIELDSDIQEDRGLPDNDADNKIVGLLKQFQEASDTTTRIKSLESLRGAALRQNPDLIPILHNALTDPDPSVQLAAVDLINEYKNSTILPLVAEAMSSDNEDVRKSSLMSLSEIDDPQVGTLLCNALSDALEDVRLTSLETAAEHKSDSIKLEVMRAGIISPYEDVKSSTAWILQEQSDHASIDILIEGMRGADAGSQQLINESLDFLLDHQFKTYEEAQQWWADNYTLYDRELFLIEDN